MASTRTTSPPPGGDQGVADQARDKARQATGQAQEKALQVTGEAKGRAREQVDRRSTEAGERVTSTAGDLRSVGEQLRKQGQEKPAKLAEQAADRAERVGGYLQESDADRILGDVEDFARRQPWAVVAGGIALGLVASRLLKASSSDRYQKRGGFDGPAPAG
jgi:gas vesicle protein